MGSSSGLFALNVYRRGGPSDHLGTAVSSYGDDIIVGATSANATEICGVDCETLHTQAGAVLDMSRHEGGANHFGIVQRHHGTHSGQKFGESLLLNDALVIMAAPDSGYLSIAMRKQICVSCSAGQFKTSPGAQPCDNCSAGEYVLDASSGPCTTCPAHSNTHFASGRAGTLASDCKCNNGYTGVDGSACTACVPGKYKNESGSAACTDCPA